MLSNPSVIKISETSLSETKCYWSASHSAISERIPSRLPWLLPPAFEANVRNCFGGCLSRCCQFTICGSTFRQLVVKSLYSSVSHHLVFDFLSKCSCISKRCAVLSKCSQARRSSMIVKRTGLNAHGISDTVLRHCQHGPQSRQTQLFMYDDM